jgi:hypothetical protein
LAGLSNRLDTSDKCKGLAGGPLLHTRIRHDLYSTAVDDCGVTKGTGYFFVLSPHFTQRGSASWTHGTLKPK